MIKKEELLKEKEKKQEAIKRMKDNMMSLEFDIKRHEDKVEELDAELKKFSGRAERGGKYHYIWLNASGATVVTEDDLRCTVDDDRFNSGNYWLEVGECQKEADYINFRSKAKKWTRENDPDFKPDWTDKETLKFSICYIESDDNFLIIRTQSFYAKGVFYFSSVEIAEKFKDEFADELKRG